MDVADLPLAPRNPLPFLQQLAAVKSYHTGTEVLRDAGGPVTRIVLGPRWLMPPIVLATSPQAIRDILTVKDGSVDKTTPVLAELRDIIGANVVNLPHNEWLPRRRTLQPVFTKQRVSRFAGHMTEAAELVCAQWGDGAEIDLDAQAHNLTLHALGRSVLGLDLDDRADSVDKPLDIALRYAVSRALRPLRAPRWLPTPSRRRARQASATLHGVADEALQACRADPTHDAPLVQALISATDPVSGEALSDTAIRNELIIFLFAGFDTIATTITYTMWQLGHHPEIQDRVAAEVAALGHRRLTSADTLSLSYTTQVIREALRICPPAPTGTRLATRDLQVGGYRVKAGTTLAFGRKAVQCDPQLWDNPRDFDPDRFTPENMAGRDRWQYLPFGGGPRSCIGDHFAMLEATLALATFMQRFTNPFARRTDFPLTAHFTMVARRIYPCACTCPPRSGEDAQTERRSRRLSRRHPRRSRRQRPYRCSTNCAPTLPSSSWIAAMNNVAGLHRLIARARSPELAAERTRWAVLPVAPHGRRGAGAAGLPQPAAGPQPQPDHRRRASDASAACGSGSPGSASATSSRTPWWRRDFAVRYGWPTSTPLSCPTSTACRPLCWTSA